MNSDKYLSKKSEQSERDVTKIFERVWVTRSGRARQGVKDEKARSKVRSTQSLRLLERDEAGLRGKSVGG